MADIASDLAAWNDGLGLVLTVLSITSLLASAVGFVLGKRRKERGIIATLIDKIDHLTDRMVCVEDQNATRAELAQANLRLSFNVAQELVNQGANGDLKRSVNDLREMVIVNSIPPAAHATPAQHQM